MAEVKPELKPGDASDPAYPDRSKTLADQEAFMAEDFEFLQKRTRWWLETVFNEALDDAKPTAEILDNGQVLLRLGQGVDKILENPAQDYKEIFKSVPGTTMKAKYLAYEHVDKFLKVCRHLGMDDTVLLTSADVVEHKNPRRVSLLLRDLSKRARAKGSNIPDFDDVTSAPKLSRAGVKGMLSPFEEEERRKKEEEERKKKEEEEKKKKEEERKKKEEEERKRKEEEEKKRKEEEEKKRKEEERKKKEEERKRKEEEEKKKKEEEEKKKKEEEERRRRALATPPKPARPMSAQPPNTSPRKLPVRPESARRLSAPSPIKRKPFQPNKHWIP